jgi:predicted SAM-dependent methyltransferase
MSPFSLFRSKARPKLHIGAGRARLEGWVNMDIQKLPGVDVVADVTKGLDFENVEAIFAEHFLEHLAIDDALNFLGEAHRVMGEGGWLRLSTPNLDWVWSTHYQLGIEPPIDPDIKRDNALHLNRAFHGWRHRFLWNREMLDEALAASGFAPVHWCRYGESELPVFQGIERHEKYQDAPDLPHVIIAEACKGAAQPERLKKFRALVQNEFLAHMAD